MKRLTNSAYVLAICFICLLALTACGTGDKIVAKVTGHATKCINGVEYLQFASGATVAYNPDGTVKQCE